MTIAPISAPAAVAPAGSSKLRPAVLVVSFDPARDAEAFAKTMELAFEKDDIKRAAWPCPRPSLEDRIRYGVRNNSRSSYVAPETVRCTALVDGRPVGFSVWSSPRDRTATAGEPTEDEKAADAAREAELEATKEAIEREREAHFDGGFFKSFKKAMAAGRKARYGGRPFWLLEILCVDPAAQGLGVGKALLAWGFERADRDRLPIYLEATKAGKPVYERAHFETVGDIVFPGGQVGTDLSLLAMERPPQPLAEPPKAATSVKADDVVLSFVDDADWPEVMRTKLLAMVGDPLYETSAPVVRRPDFETQVKWGVYNQRRMSPAVARDFEFVKATRPSEPGRVLGYAVWEKPRIPTESNPDPAPTSEAAERVDEELEAIFEAVEDRVFLKDFKTRGRKIREDYHAGAPFWYLGLLVVHPESQGLGVGKKLINWGLDKADAAGLPTHCESSPVGERVYPRFGFEPIGWLNWVYVDGTPTRSPSFCRQPKRTTA